MKAIEINEWCLHLNTGMKVVLRSMRQLERRHFLAGTGSAMKSSHPAPFPSANLSLERGKSSIDRFFSEHLHLPSPPKKPSWGHFSHCSPKLHKSNKIISFWAHPIPPPGWWCWEGIQHNTAPNLRRKPYRLLQTSSAYGSGILRNPQCSQSLGYPFV